MVGSPVNVDQRVAGGESSLAQCSIRTASQGRLSVPDALRGKPSGNPISFSEAWLGPCWKQDDIESEILARQGLIRSTIRSILAKVTSTQPGGVFVERLTILLMPILLVAQSRSR